MQQKINGSFPFAIKSAAWAQNALLPHSSVLLALSRWYFLAAVLNLRRIQSTPEAWTNLPRSLRLSLFPRQRPARNHKLARQTPVETKQNAGNDELKLPINDISRGLLRIHMDIREFTKPQQLRQWRRNETIIFERGKVIVLHVLHAFYHIFLRYNALTATWITKIEVLTKTRAYHQGRI